MRALVNPGWKIIVFLSPTLRSVIKIPGNELFPE